MNSRCSLGVFNMADGVRRVLNACLVLLMGCADCGPLAEPRPEPVLEQSSADLPAVLTAPLPAHFARGICVAHSWEQNGQHGYGTPTSAATLRELHGLGADWVSLTPFGFMGSLQDPHVHHVGEMRGGERDDRVRAEIREALACGHSVLLKPHIWVSGGAWRAEIAPPNWDDWFVSYAAWIMRYAQMAQDEGVSILAVGTELRSTARFETAWRTLITEIRQVFHGRVIYCANWDGLEAVQFWDAVDYIGVQFYAPLAEDRNATEVQMSARLATYLDRMGALSARVGRPVMLTEVGYKSTEDAAIRPYEWTERGDSPVDELMQVRAYQVLFEGVRARP